MVRDEEACRRAISHIRVVHGKYLLSGDSTFMGAAREYARRAASEGCPEVLEEYERLFHRRTAVKAQG